MREIQGEDMAQPTDDDPRWIRVRVSRINLAITLVGAALAMPLLFLVPMAPAVRVAILVLFLAAMAFDLVLALLLLPSSVVAFHFADPEAPLSMPVTDTRSALGVRIRRRGDAGPSATPEQDGTVLSGSFVTPWLTALRYRLPGDPAWRRIWPRVIPLWPDSIPADDFRRTRVVLKWK